jgi:hypothetical protein
MSIRLSSNQGQNQENPNPASLSDNDQPSPLQYQKERSAAAAGEPFDDKSAMEEEDDCEMIGMYEEEVPERFVAPITRASNKMLANFINVTRKFTETLEDAPCVL